MLAPGAEHIDIEAPLADFTRDGYACLGVIVSAPALAALRQRCNALMQGTVVHPGLYFQHDAPGGRYADLAYGKGWVGPSLAYRKVEGLERDPVLRAWIENGLFARLAHAVIGAEVSLYRAVLWNKAARAGTELPWHQDDGRFWGIDRAPRLQIWTALDDAPADGGCVEVVPGTHFDGLASPQGGTVQPDRVAASGARERAVKLVARAGEVVLIHNHLWHRSGRNGTPLPRRAISVSLLDAATRCLRRRHAPRTFTRLFGAADRAPAAQPLEDDLPPAAGGT